MKRYIVIMAGGVGTRFWPSSTEDRPKQFLDILGIGQTLLQMTYHRSLKIVDASSIIIMTNKKYFSLVKEQLPELPETNILCEPSRNDTAPCIAYATLHIHSRDKNALFAILSSDHVILYEDKFVEAIDQAFTFSADHDCITTLGIHPTRPDTGYGYIHFLEDESLFKKVLSFKEKPAMDVAAQYLAEGDYLWNAGMFITSTKTFIRAFQLHATQIIETLLAQPEKYNTPEEQTYIDSVYPLTNKISIDYAIMEKADNIFTIVSDIGWTDLGTWASLYDYSVKDENGNVIQSGQQVIEDTKDCIIRVHRDKKIMIKGLSDYIVIDENHALLIYPKHLEQEIKSALTKF